MHGLWPGVWRLSSNPPEEPLGLRHARLANHALKRVPAGGVGDDRLAAVSRMEEMGGRMEEMGGSRGLKEAEGAGCVDESIWNWIATTRAYTGTHR
jgi:hypothetical protein